MRVIAGSARGKRLKAPAGLHTRPITDMIKEALFNVWGQEIIEASVLDLFAGSGSVGIEALSRGAGRVVMVDNDKNAIQVIKENLANCGINVGFEIFFNDVFKAVDLLNRHQEKFDFIYIDPPFTNDKIFAQIMQLLGEIKVLASDGSLVIRTKKQKEMAESYGHLYKYRSRIYGESCLHYYTWTEEDSKI
ncbi:RNA methyltransferase, RsmD [Syntrophomonas zehnderi OL-4]|uniref:RNA methyltransferase, RsmD n=1 Tax=Syntrophomonas zehnderi OL-4 TaxID=690567 RepID=A0A0E3W3U0_9FIRM|nr:16S rRNA (guanine(966)-N(2))-methyltransferase RsmD [Syntrophomonas zehnderi]CFY04893.1 RNA methyltransferase, RsmD [Syntrophomonas zehnderi OL-4]